MVILLSFFGLFLLFLQLYYDDWFVVVTPRMIIAAAATTTAAASTAVLADRNLLHCSCCQKQVISPVVLVTRCPIPISIFIIIIIGVGWLQTLDIMNATVSFLFLEWQWPRTTTIRSTSDATRYRLGRIDWLAETECTCSIMLQNTAARLLMFPLLMMKLTAAGRFTITVISSAANRKFSWWNNVWFGLFRKSTTIGAATATAATTGTTEPDCRIHSLTIPSPYG